MRRLPPTVWSFLAALALLLAWGHGSAGAEDAPAPKPPRNTLEAAQQFAAAFAARDETRMQALAGSTRHDAWFTLDWMLSGDAYDAANAWAARVGSDAHGMAKYIEAHRASPVPGPERRRLNLVKTLRNKGDIPGVLVDSSQRPEYH